MNQDTMKKIRRRDSLIFIFSCILMIRVSYADTDATASIIKKIRQVSVSEECPSECICILITDTEMMDIQCWRSKLDSNSEPPHDIVMLDAVDLDITKEKVEPNRNYSEPQDASIESEQEKEQKWQADGRNEVEENESHEIMKGDYLIEWNNVISHQYRDTSDDQMQGDQPIEDVPGDNIADDEVKYNDFSSSEKALDEHSMEHGKEEVTYLSGDKDSVVVPKKSPHLRNSNTAISTSAARKIELSVVTTTPEKPFENSRNYSDITDIQTGDEMAPGDYAEQINSNLQPTIMVDIASVTNEETKIAVNSEKSDTEVDTTTGLYPIKENVQHLSDDSAVTPNVSVTNQIEDTTRIKQLQSEPRISDDQEKMQNIQLLEEDEVVQRNEDDVGLSSVKPETAELSVPITMVLLGVFAAVSIVLYVFIQYRSKKLRQSDTDDETTVATRPISTISPTYDGDEGSEMKVLSLPLLNSPEDIGLPVYKDNGESNNLERVVVVNDIPNCSMPDIPPANPYITKVPKPPRTFVADLSPNENSVDVNDANIQHDSKPLSPLAPTLLRTRFFSNTPQK